MIHNMPAWATQIVEYVSFFAPLVQLTAGTLGCLVSATVLVRRVRLSIRRRRNR